MKKAFIQEKIDASAKYQVILTSLASAYSKSDVTSSYVFNDYLEAREKYKEKVVSSSAHLTHIDASRVVSLYRGGKLMMQTYIETIEY